MRILRALAPAHRIRSHKALACAPIRRGITSSFSGVTLETAGNVYFGGKCVSHAFVTADGAKKSVGVVLPAELTFNTAAAEIMECVAGSAEYKLAGSEEWKAVAPGESFSIPADSSFDIKVDDAFHYICSYAE
mmetsp:Transcript_36709/g.71181  ORF Transcript_36709/g.71181 Transcript_36709/m.71181 type:complete len:133 (-) Transcript_36709:162-560(-)